MIGKDACALRPLYAAGIFVFLTAFGAHAGVLSEKEAFRVCADPNNLPFSHKNGRGFENRLAELWASELGVPVTYTWFPQRRGFIRNTLRAQDPITGQYKCDVVIGVPAGFELAITTRPYYRSTYALVYVKGRGLDDVQTAKDLVTLDTDRRDNLRIGIYAETPAALWLARYGMSEQMIALPAMAGDPDAYPGEIVEKDLVAGKLDAAIIWGPIAGYFGKAADGVQMKVIPMQSEPGIRFDFAIAAAVRHGEGEAKRELEKLIEQTAGQIDAVLAEYNVPRLEQAATPFASDVD